uniref:Fibronectin type-III domain-containing protein n=1 Tax=Amphimedon queenslandica TaxID=400682 RepID=A0A1X7UDY5_AMPQE
MATATGIYWCLVLTGYISLVVSAYEQSPSTVCPGDELVFTCATVNGGTVRWRLNGNDGQFVLLAGSSPPTTLGSFSLKVTQYNAPNTIATTATNDPAPVSLNGTSIDCAEGLTGQYKRKFINYPGPPPAVSNINIEAIDNDSLFINWTSSVPAQVVNISWDQISNDSITIWWNNTQDYSISTIPVPPIHYYIITVYNTSNSIIYNSNTTNTNITITGLPLTDTNYTVTIIPVNVIGYGPSATVNVSVTSITPTMTSTSSVTNTPSSVTLTDISTSTSVRYTSSTSRSSTIYEQSSSFISATGTSAGITTTMSTLSTTTVSATAGGSNAVPIISGATGTVFVIIIIIIILVLVILAIKKQRRQKYKISKKEAFSSTDGAVTPTYDEIIVKPTTTTGVPIYDTPMELQANTAYDLIAKKNKSDTVIGIVGVYSEVGPSDGEINNIPYIYSTGNKNTDVTQIQSHYADLAIDSFRH